MEERGRQEGNGRGQACPHAASGLRGARADTGSADRNGFHQTGSVESGSKPGKVGCLAPLRRGEAGRPQVASRMALVTFSMKVSTVMVGVFQYCVTASWMAPWKFGVVSISIDST